MDFFEGKDIRQASLSFGAEECQGGPVALERVGEEEAGAAAGDFERAGGELFAILQVEQIIADLFFMDLLERWLGAESAPGC